MDDMVRALSDRVSAAHKGEYHDPEKTDAWFYTIYSDGEVTYEGRGWSRGCTGMYAPPVPGALALGLQFKHVTLGNDGVTYSYSYVTREQAMEFVEEIKRLVAARKLQFDGRL